jgi:hypothetical protein
MKSLLIEILLALPGLIYLALFLSSDTPSNQQKLLVRKKRIEILEEKLEEIEKLFQEEHN